MVGVLVGCDWCAGWCGGWCGMVMVVGVVWCGDGG